LDVVPSVQESCLVPVVKDAGILFLQENYIGIAEDVRAALILMRLSHPMILFLQRCPFVKLSG